MPTVIISGGTGLVGKALTQLLVHQGYGVIVLTRDKNRKNETGIQYAHWDIKNNQIERNALLQADYIIHLAGAGVVDKKWTPAYKKEIVESRTKSIHLITDGLREIQHHVK
ncbi:MAG: NAD-dependent epimerase/dehydratase family protein, partial [Ferruginibacter sp.]|nr:NAD-dependent epimerase/dehydratase family protein [Ferruginibacter sp.]